MCSKSARILSSVLYFNAFLGMGMLLSNLGPVLPQLMARTGLRIGAMGMVDGDVSSCDPLPHPWSSSGKAGIV